MRQAQIISKCPLNWWEYNTEQNTYLVNTNWFPVQFYHVHYFDRIISIFFSHEFYKAIALMHLSYTVFGHVDIYWEEKQHGLLTEIKGIMCIKEWSKK